MNQKIFIAVMLAGGVVAGQRALADETADAINELKQEIQALDQKVRVLERQKEIDTEAADAKAKETPRITVGNDGLSVNSADSNFVFQLHGQVQVDSRTFFGDRNNNGQN